MIDAKNKIEYIKSEEEDYYANDDIYNFNSWGADLSFRELIERYENDELLKPELQRHYIWDKTEASYFIDSILLGLPVPSIFLAKQTNETLIIIDGYQRILTVYDYVRGIFSQDNKVFKLSNSPKINDRWKGKAFSELTDSEQRRIRSTTIHAIIFVQTQPLDNNTGMYQVFERINTTGRSLTSQEIRNCVYYGNMNKLLFELNLDEVWRKLFGTDQPDSRMRDMEFILRYFTLKSIDFDSLDVSSISLKKELNLFMGNQINNSENSISSLRADFKKTITLVNNLFGNVAFHNISSKYPDKLVSKFNPTIFDSIMIAVSRSQNIDPNINIENKRRRLLLDDTYQNVIRFRTTDVTNIKTRFQIASKYLFG